MVDKRTTKLKILDAAEELFAETGFAETSLRQITKKAEVNLASVNYHFGSKKELIQAVLERYFQVFIPKVSIGLADLENQYHEPNLEAVFSVLVEPVLALNTLRKNGANIFLQLLGRGYTDSQGHLRRFFLSHYGQVLTSFVGLVHRAHPELPDSEIFWRMHFTLGTLVFTMASNQAFREIAAADFNQDVDVEGVIRRIVPFIAAGVGAPVQQLSN